MIGENRGFLIDPLAIVEFFSRGTSLNERMDEGQMLLSFICLMDICQEGYLRSLDQYTSNLKQKELRRLPLLICSLPGDYLDFLSWLNYIRTSLLFHRVPVAYWSRPMYASVRKHLPLPLHTQNSRLFQSYQLNIHSSVESATSGGSCNASSHTCHLLSYSRRGRVCW